MDSKSKQDLMDQHNPKGRDEKPRMPTQIELGKNKSGKDILPKN